MGLRLVSPNSSLSEEYFQSARESLNVLVKVLDADSKIWTATIKYYVEYFAVYSVLVHLGIISEIHECTIAVAQFLEEEGILRRGVSSLLTHDKGLRIDNQYYLKHRPMVIDIPFLSDFLSHIKAARQALGPARVESLRIKLHSSREY